MAAYTTLESGMPETIAHFRSVEKIGGGMEGVLKIEYTHNIAVI
jgi:hypothetical protein